MIIIGQTQLSEIEALAETAYPQECCGLLVGQEDENRDVRITRVVASRNISATDRDDRFEIDPQVRFDLMRELRGSSERMVGHYHSHPDHPARPSATDAEMAFEPDLIWIIAAVVKGRATETAAFQATGAAAFRELTLEIAGPRQQP